MKKSKTIKCAWAIAIILLFNMQGYAQSKYFEKTYRINNNYNHNGFAIVEKTDGSYMITGETVDSINTFWRTYLMNIDKLGNLVASYQYSNINQQHSSSRDIVQINEKYYIGGWSVMNEKAETYFMSIEDYYLSDSLLVGQAAYPDNAYTICSTTDKHFFLGGEIQPYDTTVQSPPTHPYLVKLDSTGNKLWDTIYYQYGPPHYAWFIDSKPSLDNGVFLLGTDKANFYYGDILLLKIDADGEIEWEKILNYDNNEWPSDMAQTPDRGYFIAGYWANNFVFPRQRGGLLIKLDSSRNEIWHNSDYFIDYGASGGIEMSSDSNYVISGGFKGSDSYLDVEMIKLDGDGDLLWRRVYPGVGYFNKYVYDMVSSSDGGFVMCGRFDTLGLAKVYVLKTNCMGLLTEPAAAFTTYQTGNSPLEVAFANASQYVYPDSIDGGHYVWDFGDGSPPFVCGQGFGACPDVVLHSYAAQGQYTASLRAVVCSDTSQVAQSVVVVWNGTANPDKPKPLLHLTPNPANNTLYLTLSGTAAPISGIWHLYDATGRQVRQSSLLVTPQPSSIPIADLPEGIYIWQFYSHNTSQAVQSGKISILRSF